MTKSTLQNIADIQMGYQARSRIDFSAEGEYRIIQGRDISADNIIVTDNLSRFKSDEVPERYLLNKGDVLFMSKGSNNYATCLEESLPNTVVSSSFYVIKLNTDKILPCYLAWWLNQADAQEYFNKKQSSGATISFINSEALRNAPVLIPAMAIQEKVIRLVKLSQCYRQINDRLALLQDKLIVSTIMNAIKHKEKA